MNVRSALVTGAGGFIGSALVRHLLNHQVRTLALVRPRVDGTLPPLPAGAVPLVARESTTAEFRRLFARQRADVVFHLASAGVLHQGSQDEIVRGNVDLLMQLLPAVPLLEPRRFLLAGSCFAYGGSTGAALVETMRPEPLSLYGACKLAAYYCGRALADSLEIPFAELRLFQVYGPGEHPDRLVPYLMRRLSGGQTAELTSGRQRRDFIHLDDVVRAFWAAATCDCLDRFDLYNVCTGQGNSVGDIARTLCSLLGVSESLLRLGVRSARTADAPEIVGSPQRFRDVAGWQPRIDLTAGLSRLILEQPALVLDRRSA